MPELDAYVPECFDDRCANSQRVRDEAPGYGAQPLVLRGILRWPDPS